MQLHVEEAHNEFIKTLNALHPTNTFMEEYSKKSIHDVTILDVTIDIENDALKTDFFVKSTETHQY